MCGDSDIQLFPLRGNVVYVDNYIVTAIGYKLVEDKKVKTIRMYLSTRGFFVDNPEEAACFSDPRAAHEFLHSCPMDITPTNRYKLIPHTVAYQQVNIRYCYKSTKDDPTPVLCFNHTLTNKFVDANGNEIRRLIKPDDESKEETK